jgi:hypothetical protein
VGVTSRGKKSQSISIGYACLGSLYILEETSLLFSSSYVSIRLGCFRYYRRESTTLHWHEKNVPCNR